jgi:hypothetical protein
MCVRLVVRDPGRVVAETVERHVDRGDQLSHILSFPLNPRAAVVGFRTVVIREHAAEAAVAEDGAAELADLGRRRDPARSFEIEFA